MTENIDQINLAEKSFWMEYLAGWAGGIGRVLTGQPFDMVKTRIQVQDSKNPTYSGSGDCFKKIYKNEGLLAFYKGTAIPLAAVGSVSALHFMTYAQTRKFFKVKKIKNFIQYLKQFSLLEKN